MNARSFSIRPIRAATIYNTTKMQDQLLFAFYNKNDRLRITNLHQGIVWGRRVGFLVNLLI